VKHKRKLSGHLAISGNAAYTMRYIARNARSQDARRAIKALRDQGLPGFSLQSFYDWKHNRCLNPSFNMVFQVAAEMTIRIVGVRADRVVPGYV